jgi:hypothetical protein
MVTPAPIMLANDGLYKAKLYAINRTNALSLFRGSHEMTD